MKTSTTRSIVAALLCAVSTTEVLAEGTAFTYQGRLNENGNPGNGSYDLRFAIYDAAMNGAAVAGPLTYSPVAVSNGLFTVTLDFGGGVFSGANRWLQIDTRTNGGGAFMALSPRQLLTPSPYAITAENLVSGGLVGTYTNATTLNNPANNFTGNGSGLMNVDAASVGGLSAANFWQLGGNPGTTPGTHFLGTPDNQALELKVNGERAFRIEPNSGGAPNIIGGASFNAVGPDYVGSTIGGGGATNYLGALTYLNRIDADFGVIGGGADNRIQTYAQYSTIGGGQNNVIQTNSNYGAIAGGYINTIQADSLFAFIGGGVGNGIQANASESTISGGENNNIQINADHSTIGGGRNNLIQTSATNSTIGGGELNSVQPGASHSTIGGGSQNNISAAAVSATISGGSANAVSGNYSSVGGGKGNFAGSLYASIGGGLANTNSAEQGMIGGGSSNSIAGFDSYGATVGGGAANTILTANEAATVAGGEYNKIQNGAQGSTISGGAYNNIRDIASFSIIAGGYANTIQTNASHSAIGGGGDNTIQKGTPYATIAGGAFNTSAGQYATVPGGFLNSAAGDYSFAAGQRAKANHQGALVWADSTPGDFASTANDQFLIRATGGVGIGLPNPTAALDVSDAARVRGTLRNGSEVGTSEPPNPSGLVVRRINSTSTSAGQVIARTDTLTLERDGTAGGMLVRNVGSTAKLTINWLGMKGDGTLVSGSDSGNWVGGAIIGFMSDGENIVHIELSFGRTYDAGQQLTRVVLDRFYDSLSNGSYDFYWSGTVTSTYNQ